MLQAVEAFVNEDNFTVWSDLSVNLATLSILLQYTDCHDSFRAFCVKLFEPVAAKLGWSSKEGEGKSCNASTRELVCQREWYKAIDLNDFKSRGNATS